MLENLRGLGSVAAIRAHWALLRLKASVLKCSLATASAPYATATVENGDTTNVVSASYVKGAYNDAIAAINTVAADVSDLSGSLDDKQDNLYTTVNNQQTPISTEIKQDLSTATETDLVSGDAINLAIGAKQDTLYYATTQPGLGGHSLSVHNSISNEIKTSSDTLNRFDETHLVSAGAVVNTVNNTVNNKRISAVTTWGNDTPTQLQLTNASN